MSRAMKHSGIEWIGEIPKEWRQYRIKYNTFLKGRIGWQGLNSNDFIDEGYCLITGTDFDNKGGINWNTCYRISKERFDEDELLHVKEGDLLMTKDGTVGKMAIIKALPEEASLNSHLLIIRQLTNLIDNSFLYWAMLSDVFKGFCLYYQSGTIMSSISQSTLGFFACYCPSLSEQQKIANYLDKVCGEVDEMIALQEQMIEELKAYKQSVITEAVTKGLNPDVPMKDSGIDWIGEVPVHWEVRRIGNLFKLRDEKNYMPMDEVQLLSLYTGIGVFPHGEQEERGNKAITVEGYKVVHKDDIVVNIILAWMGAIGVSNYDGVTSPAYDVYIPDLSKVVPHFFHYVFRTQGIAGECYKYGRGIMMMRWRTYSSEFKQIRVPFPSMEEQQLIADFLDTKCSEIDALIAIKQAKIDELKDYKKSVIYEYVTGKKEVGED